VKICSREGNNNKRGDDDAAEEEDEEEEGRQPRTRRRDISMEMMKKTMMRLKKKKKRKLRTENYISNFGNEIQDESLDFKTDLRGGGKDCRLQVQSLSI